MPRTGLRLYLAPKGAREESERYPRKKSKKVQMGIQENGSCAIVGMGSLREGLLTRKKIEVEISPSGNVGLKIKLL